MSRYILLLIFCGIIAGQQEAQSRLVCKQPRPDIPQDWITLASPCTKKMKEQIQEELVAAMTYLAMGAHFSRDSINRPGFAHFFFESASEERDHAIKLIQYLIMRGELTQDISQLIRDPQPLHDSWLNGISALKDALKLEAHVTRKLREIIITCEDPGTEAGNFNDYHLVDWMTAEYLDEQYKGQRKLAGYISELGKMVEAHGELGEWLYDKELSGKSVPA